MSLLDQIFMENPLMNKPLQSKRALITGGAQGLGSEISKKFILAGANVMICGRDDDSLKKIQNQLAALIDPGQRVEVFKADISKDVDIDALVGVMTQSLGGCDILVNNAGVYGPKGLIEDIDWADWVKTIEINLMGSIKLCRKLIPIFRAQSYGKIIQLSGGGATNPLPRLSAYAVSKAGIIRFSETIAEELRGTGVDVNAIAPGALNTRMLDEILSSDPAVVGRDFYEKAVKQKQAGGTSLDLGADLAVYLASPISDGVTGKLISAVWDDWQHFHDYLIQLNGSDIYTLRRIVPEDRNITLGKK